MNVAIVVQRFPILSESFIIRMVESLHAEGASVCIYATESADTSLLQELAPKLHHLITRGEVELVSSKFSDAPSGIGAKWHSALINLCRSPFFVASLLLRGIGIRQALQASSFRRLRGSRQHDVIHAQFLPMAVAVVSSNFPKRTDFPKVVSYVRGYDISRRGAVSAQELALLSGPHGLSSITCVSQSLADMVQARGFPPQRIEVIHSGIPIEHLPFKLPSERPKRPIHFIQVGRLVEKKGYDLSLHMLSQLGVEDYSFEIIGQGDLNKDLESLVAQLGLGRHVKFSGALSHSRTIESVAAADIMLIPSRQGSDGDSEGIPNVAKEAMALGVICIGSTHSGIPEIIRDNETGFLFKEDSLSDYVECTRRAIGAASQWDRIARSARSLIKRDFEVTGIARKLLAHYSKHNVSLR